MTVHSCAVGDSGNNIAACSAFCCSAEWSRKAVNEARPWWRRDSSSWKWVSQRDWEEPLLSAADPVSQPWRAGAARCLTCLEYCNSSPHGVWMGPPRARLCLEEIFILWIWESERAIIVIFQRPSLCFCPPHRSSEFWRDQTVDLQDRLQAPVRAEEMQP